MAYDDENDDFSGLTTGGGAVQNIPALPISPGYDVSQRLRQLFQPANTAQQNYASIAGNMPVRQDPSTFHKILAAVAGMGAGASPVGIAHGAPIGFRYDPRFGAMASENILYGDYDRKLEDWKNQLGAAAIPAKMEEQQNVLGLKSAQDVIHGELTEQARQIAQEKERNIHEDAIRKADDARKKAEDALAEKQREFDLHRDDVGRLRDLQEARERALEARWELDRAQRERQFNSKMGELTDFHNSERDNWQRQRDQYDEYLRQRGLQFAPTTETTTTKGNVVTKSKTRDTSAIQPVPSHTQPLKTPPPSPTPGYHYVLKPDGSGYTAVPDSPPGQ